MGRLMTALEGSSSRKCCFPPSGRLAVADVPSLPG